jgi:hypothetical protein
MKTFAQMVEDAEYLGKAEHAILDLGIVYGKFPAYDAWWTFHYAGPLGRQARRDCQPCYMHKTFQDF